MPSSPLTELVGNFEGHIAVFAVPRARAAAALPPGLVLLEQAASPAGTHPILVWFGRQRDVHLTRLRVLPGFPLDYLEVIAGVPFVGRERGGGGPYLHLGQLFLDSAMAVFGGYTLWGFPKKMARMSAAAGVFEVRPALLGARILRCEAEPRGARRSMTSLPGAPAIAALLAQPLIEGAMGNLGPPVVGSTFAWELDDATAEPARARLALGDAFVPSIAGEHEVPPLGEGGLGAFHIASRWRLSLPYLPPR